jgi:3-deoxy-7-phosphoheptulonate synthase
VTDVDPTHWAGLPAAQQPDWHSRVEAHRIERTLRHEEPLVTINELDQLTGSLAQVALGRAQMLQVGDCAERLDECTACCAADNLTLLDELANELARASGQPAVRIGRLGGQLAKPRTKPTEWHGDVELPAFRGHMVNSEEATAQARTHDPQRMLWSYHASAEVHAEVRRRRAERHNLHLNAGSGPWTSHEALVMDYEGALTRRDLASGKTYLASTHFPWIGERTRQPDSGHVALLASVDNPVGCKIGPKADTTDVLALCAVLDPNRTPGRLTLICRMGRDHVGRVLPEVVEAVAAAGHPVIWLCDPMHGNTVTRSGTKTRILDDLLAEVLVFRSVIESEGAYPGGLHLEAGRGAVTECIGAGVQEHHLHEHYTSLCDPRLNLKQTIAVLEAWTG